MSILYDTKTYLGLMEDDTSFDSEVKDAIDNALATATAESRSWRPIIRGRLPHYDSWSDPTTVRELLSSIDVRSTADLVRHQGSRGFAERGGVATDHSMMGENHERRNSVSLRRARHEMGRP